MISIFMKVTKSFKELIIYTTLLFLPCIIIIKPSCSLEFSYDPQSEIGPNQWEFVDVSQSEYWDYFKNDTTVIDHTNDCNNPKGKESPLNLDPNVDCQDDHQIKTSRGKDNFDSMEFSILPYALRANISKRKGAKANFSNLSKGVNATHLEIKIPSEHYLFGQQFPGELVISHYFPDKGGELINIGVMLDDSMDKHNIQLEQFIREWEEVAWQRQSICDDIQYKRNYEYPSKDEMIAIWGAPKLKKEANYDLYKLLPTLWYCGYNGGITIPPCTKSVVWRILDLPLMMSKSQLQRMQNLIIGRMDENCNTNSSFAYIGAVNRPLQEIKLPNVWCCTSHDWKFGKLKDLKSDWFERRMKWPTYYHGFK